MIRIKLIVKGLVQGVGFRFFTKLTSTKLNITGYVKNLDNGDVLIEAQGTRSNLDKLKVQLYKGNGFCKVVSIEETKLDIISSEKNFIF